MRLMGIDVGERRVGLAVSDTSGTLARPLTTLERTSSVDALLDEVVAAIDRLAAEGDAVTLIVIGLPMRLDGSANAATERARAFAAQLGNKTKIPMAFQDERLSSREAESRLALRERDWRVRKKRLDAAAAAVILQDHIDEHPPKQG
jgi:putative Holliday junction resolvase